MALAGELRSSRDQAVERFIAHVRAQVQDHVADAGGVGDAGSDSDANLQEMIGACVDSVVSAIERGGTESVSLPDAVIEHARTSARAGVSLSVALARCVAVFTLARKDVLRRISELALTAVDERTLMLESSDAIGAMLGKVQAAVVAAHGGRVAVGTRPREHRRAEVAERLLTGAQPSAEELDDLGYEFDAWHAAVIIVGADAGNLVRRMEAALGCEILPIVRGPDELHAWLGAQRRLRFEDVVQSAGLGSERKSLLAGGETARGLQGWRLTYRQAESAASIARLRRSPVTRYRDVALEAAALQDEALGKALIARCLEPLEDARGGGELRRRIVRAIFAAEYNKTSAGCALDLDRDTIRNHITVIERRLGCRLCEVQAEIEIALRVEELRQLEDQGRDD